MIWHMLSKLNARVLSFDSLILLLTWLSALTGAAITFISRNGAGNPRTLRGFARFLLPPHILKHRSVRLDVLYYLAQHLMLPVLAIPFFLSCVAVSDWLYGRLTAQFGAHAQHEPGLALWIALLALVWLVTDFSVFLQHYVFHKFGPFWQFHKSHHSSEVLVPLSNRRIHPFDEVLDIGLQAVLTGVTTGITSYVFSLPVYEGSIAGLDVYFIGNLLSFYHLRHSHIDMSYGWLDKWVMSPGQHQLHHSLEPEHWDRNFGLTLAIWDRMFGTLLAWQPHGSFRMGLPDSERAGYDTLWGLYVTPVRNNVTMALAALRTLGIGILAPRPRPLGLSPGDAD